MARPISSETVFHAVANEKRRRIVLALRGGETAAGQILPPGELSRPALSQHLRILREAGIVAFRQKGNRLIYRVNAKALWPIREFLSRVEPSRPGR